MVMSFKVGPFLLMLCPLCVCVFVCEYISVCVQCVNEAEQEGIGAYHKEMVKGQHPPHIAECSEACLGLQSSLKPHHLRTDSDLFLFLLHIQRSRHEIVWQLFIPTCY